MLVADFQPAATTTTATSTYFIHTDPLNSTSVVTNSAGSSTQIFDYYPFGGIRVSSSTATTTELHKYIGQYYDSTGLDYLQARYYDGSKGEFLSEDPTFLAIGNPGQLQQLSTQDQTKFLSDPQQINSYSYGRDNPITNKDPQGLWALRFGINGTIPGWGLTGEIGVQADLQGAEFYYGAGLAGGLGGVGFGPQITTANLSHQYSVSTAAFAQGGAIASVELSKGMTYYPYSDRKPEPYQEASFGFPAVELSGGGMAEFATPIPFLTWSSQSKINYSLPMPQMANNVSRGQMSTYQGSRASSGGSSTSYGQVLSNLQSALQQLSAVLATYKTNSSH